MLFRRVVSRLLNHFPGIYYVPDRIRTRQSVIPLSARRGGADRKIRSGPYAGRECWYKTGLLNTLIALNPKICLEIGTHFGGTTKVFEHYFKRYRRDGILITVDIEKFIDLSDNKRIRQVLVNPHAANSVKENTDILLNQLRTIGEGSFDFAFIDGDHRESSLLKDINIVKNTSSFPHYALLDDTKEAIHESHYAYQKLRMDYNHYDFDDWPIFVGASLIWQKDK